MDDYTEGEVVRFYNACAAHERDHLRTLAVAGRVSQADKQHWKEFIRSIERSVEPVDKADKPDLSTDKGLGDFFSQAFVLTNPGTIQQAADAARQSKKPLPRSLQDVAPAEIPKTGPSPFAGLPPPIPTREPD